MSIIRQFVDSITGRLVPKAEAEARPDTTQERTVRRGSKLTPTDRMLLESALRTHHKLVNSGVATSVLARAVEDLLRRTG